MHPKLTISWLDLTISSQQLVLWSVVLAAVTIGPWWIARREQLDLRRLRAAQLWLGVASLVGARLHFLINNPHFYEHAPLRMLSPSGGMHMGGALIGLLVGVPIVARYYRLDIAKLCDGIMPLTAISLAVVRIGCLLGGCCFGTQCDRPWGIAYPPGSMPFVIQQQAGKIAVDATASLPLHPVQIYFGLAALGTAAAAIWFGNRKRYDGQIFWIALALLSISSGIVEPFRALENHHAFWRGVPQLHWIEIAMAAAALLGLAISEWRHRRSGTAAKRIADGFSPARTSGR